MKQIYLILMVLCLSVQSIWAHTDILKMMTRPVNDTEQNYYIVSIEAFAGVSINPDLKINRVPKGEAFAFTFALPDGYDQEDIIIELNGIPLEFEYLGGNIYQFTIRSVDQHTTVQIKKVSQFSVNTSPQYGYTAKVIIDDIVMNITNGEPVLGKKDEAMLEIEVEDEYKESEIVVYLNGQVLIPSALRSTIWLYQLPPAFGHFSIRIEGLHKNSIDGQVTPKEEINIHMEGNTLYLKTNHRMVIEVYNILGSLHTRRMISQGTSTFQLPKGIFIIRTGRSITKVVVR